MTARADGDLGWFLSDEAFEAEMLELRRSVDAHPGAGIAATFMPRSGRPNLRFRVVR